MGTQVVNSKNQPVTLRGVNAASLEWTSNGEGHILDTVSTAIRDWNANVVRLPLSQDRWFGKAPEQNGDFKPYRALVKQIVDACSGQNCYIILDLHWSDANVWGQEIGQHVMPDQNSAAFWKDCASAYKNNPAVLFDLYNEPHDVGWDIWLKGGTVTEHDRERNYNKTFEAVGMQALLDTVRATGAKNVVVAGGVDWAYDLSGILDGRQLSDAKGHGVIYANHAYPFKGDTVDKWAGKMRTAGQTLPLIVSEFGSDPKGGAGESGEQWVRHVLNVMKDQNLNWTAWDMHTGAAPCLISDWNYTPTPHFGVPFKQAQTGILPAYVSSPAQMSTNAQAANGASRPVYKNYPLGPDSLVHDDVPHGKLEGPFLYESSILANTIRRYWVYVPAQYKPDKAACVFVFQDGARAINPNGVIRAPNVMDNLIARKEMPVSIGIFITPGQRGDMFPDTIGFGNPDNRSAEYDSLNDAYARFVVDEMLPLVGKSYNLTKDPDGRCIGGSSSGAIAAFSVAWYRPQSFHKVISMIGSFTDIRGGHVYPELVRTTEKKPLRVFLQDGIYDNRSPDNPKRDWHLQNELMVAALKEKGYDTQYVVGEGNHSDNHGGAILPDMLRWMWRDYPK